MSRADLLNSACKARPESSVLEFYGDPFSNVLEKAEEEKELYEKIEWMKEESKSKKKPLSLEKIKVQNCNVHIDKILKSVSNALKSKPLLELSLQDSKILTHECVILAQDPRLINL